MTVGAEERAHTRTRRSMRVGPGRRTRRGRYGPDGESHLARGAMPAYGERAAGGGALYGQRGRTRRRTTPRSLARGVTLRRRPAETHNCRPPRSGRGFAEAFGGHVRPQESPPLTPAPPQRGRRCSSTPHRRARRATTRPGRLHSSARAKRVGPVTPPVPPQRDRRHRPRTCRLAHPRHRHVQELRHLRRIQKPRVHAATSDTALPPTRHEVAVDPADVFLMFAGGHGSDDWPDYIIRPEVVLEPHVAVVRKPTLPAVYQEPSRGNMPPFRSWRSSSGSPAQQSGSSDPHVTKAAPVDRGYEVIVLKAAKPKCVADPRTGSNAPQSKPSQVVRDLRCSRRPV